MDFSIGRRVTDESLLTTFAVRRQTEVDKRLLDGVLAPHAKIRKKVVPAREASEESKPSRKRMTWAQLLKRVFKIEIDRCRRCGGRLKVIAAIVKQDVIARILKHLGLPLQPPPILPPRAPPQRAWEF